MAVLRLVEKSNLHTIAVLEAMLVLARRGAVTDVAMTYLRDGAEKMAFTGVYLAQPEHAVMASLRMSILLCKRDKKPSNDL